MTKKRTHVLSHLVLLLLMSTTICASKVWVSAAPLSPYVRVVPEETLDPSITPGMNYTISVYTDHFVNNVTSWEFELTFNPKVLQMGFNINDTWTGDGSTATFTTSRHAVVENSEKVYVNQALMTRDVDYYITYGQYYESQIIFNTAPSPGAEVKAEYTWTGLTNGDLIAAAKNPLATLLPGTFDNTLGRLLTTTAFFAYSTVPPTTSGPGTFANVTFRVVGYGSSDIILGEHTCLYAPGQPPFYSPPYVIIDASKPPGATSPPYGSDHIGHGYFENIRDVAVTDLIVPATAILGDVVEINVTVKNSGLPAPIFNITVYANTMFIGNLTVINLNEGETRTFSLDWDTTTMVAGNYTVTATAWLPPGDDPKDNSRSATIEIKTLHDVAVIDLEIPDAAFTGDFVPVRVTVENQGTFEEKNVNLTIYYRPEIQYPPPPKIMFTTTLTLDRRPTSATNQTSWNTTGLDGGSYNITAKITLDVSYEDEDLSDNTKSKSVMLNVGHDVAVTSVLPNVPKVFVGETLAIDVTVQNVGGLDETSPFKVNVSCGTEASSLESIGSQYIPSLTVGRSVTLTFTWSTAGLNVEISRNYLVEAKAILDTDLHQTNNRKTYTVVVAPALGAISGIVRDASTGNPIEGAQVTAEGKSVSTNATGDYIIELPVGTYTVAVSADGYEVSYETDVTVVAGETTTVNFMLKPNEAPNILLYIAAVVGIVIAIAGTAVFLRRRKKTK